ncbi:hypothetical protein PDL71_15785 [Lacibacter sp. MH-610]|uniref:hypothetical protein n=1 Tax=Lacibacter sp. MH-610 TaxID=3020883 RepID=UPI003892AE28
MEHKPLSQEQVLYRQIDDILWTEWDPIGINDCEQARDEYYGYLPHVWRLKLQGADAETIAQYLFDVEIDRMGLNGDIEHCRKVANRIISL